MILIRPSRVKTIVVAISMQSSDFCKVPSGSLRGRDIAICNDEITIITIMTFSNQGWVRILNINFLKLLSSSNKNKDVPVSQNSSYSDSLSSISKSSSSSQTSPSSPMYFLSLSLLSSSIRRGPSLLVQSSTTLGPIGCFYIFFLDFFVHLLYI